MSAQVPDVYTAEVSGRQTQRRVHIFKAVQAARAVKLEIDVQYLSFGAPPAEPLAALGYRGREIGAVLARLLDEVAAEKLPNKPEALQARAVRLWRSGYARHTMKENETH